jgi:hypothetical protein
MNTLIEPGDIACGGILAVMRRVSLYWLGKNVQNLRETEDWE